MKPFKVYAVWQLMDNQSPTLYDMTTSKEEAESQVEIYNSHKDIIGEDGGSKFEVHYWGEFTKLSDVLATIEDRVKYAPEIADIIGKVYVYFLERITKINTVDYPKTLKRRADEFDQFGDFTPHIKGETLCTILEARDRMLSEHEFLKLHHLLDE